MQRNSRNVEQKKPQYDIDCTDRLLCARSTAGRALSCLCAQVLTSTAATRTLKLSNRSLVYARFSVERRESDVPAVFGFAPSSGIIPPDGEQARVRVRHARTHTTRRRAR
eukprot:6182999-Pleurochrysis_carterae.AAC.2